MCGLCGLLGISHWTETSAHQDAFTGNLRRTIRAERQHRASIINTILKPKRMKIADFQATSYLLKSPTGKTAIIDDVQAIWGAFEDLNGACFDPLDTEYLTQLKAMNQ